MQFQRHFGILVILLTSLFLAAGTTIAQDEPQEGADVGNLGPDFTLMNVNVKDEDGNFVDPVEFILSEQRNKVVAMTFWGWSCVSCKEEEMPLLQSEIWSNYDPEQVVVVSVNQDIEPNLDDIKGYIEEKGIGFPMVVNGLETAFNYKVFNTPILFILDGEGVIRYKQPNVFVVDEVKALLDELIAELPEPEAE